MRRVLALLALLVAAPAAAAAPPWSAPQPLSAQHRSVDRPELVAAGDGTLIATWSDARHRIAVRPPGGTFGAPLALPRADTLLAPVTHDATRFILGTETRGRLHVAFGDARTGRIGARRLIRDSRAMLRPHLAANDRGDAALVWFENRGTSTDRVYVSVRTPGGRFGKPVLVAKDRVRQTAVAVSSRGSVLVAWETAGAMKVRVASGTRRVFAGTQVLESRPTAGAIPQAAFAPNGRAYVAWATPGGPVEVAVRGAGRGRFPAARTLDAGGRHEGPVAIAVAADTTALLAWDADGAIRAAAGRAAFDAPRTLGAGIRPRVAPGLVVWEAGDAERSEAIHASVAFGAPEVVVAGGEPRVPAVAGTTVLAARGAAGARRAEAFERAG